MPYTEFLRWVAFIEREPNEFHREDYFFARMSYQLYLLQFMLGGKPKLSEKEFLIRFEQVKAGKIKEIETEEERYDRILDQQRSIAGMFGIKLDKEGKPIEQKEIPVSAPPRLPGAKKKEPKENTSYKVKRQIYPKPPKQIKLDPEIQSEMKMRQEEELRNRRRKKKEEE